MTANPNSIDLSTFICEHLERAEPDLLRSMLKTFAEALMGAEADAICGAPMGFVARSGSTLVMVTGHGSGTPGPARLRLRSRSYGQGRTSRTGCWNAAAGRSGR